METRQTVLLLGATGRTGQRVLVQLLGRGFSVRVVVRSARRLPADAAKDPGVTVVEADLLSLSDEELLRQLRGCDAVISCLGHVITLKGVFGPPRDLVTRATTRLCRGIEALQPSKPVKLVVMTSVSVHRPGRLDARRGTFERAFLWILRALVPPARDNQSAAGFLQEEVGTAGPHVQWVVVRPDTLLEGEVSEYTLHEALVSSLSAPASTRMANVAHFMCELAANPKAWGDWKGKLPVVVDAVRTPSRS
jgi:nucleoside-diphosphate-sugar epimerase